MRMKRIYDGTGVLLGLSLALALDVTIARPVIPVSAMNRAQKHGASVFSSFSTLFFFAADLSRNRTSLEFPTNTAEQAHIYSEQYAIPCHLLHLNKAASLARQQHCTDGEQEPKRRMPGANE
jgi:hypothetical protein